MCDYRKADKMSPYIQSYPVNVLVIEDNFTDFLLLKEHIYLSEIPVADIQVAETLEAAIEHLRQTRPDVVFLDLFLPDSSGLESFNQLKEHAAGSAIIILSGLSDTRTALEAIALGAQDYLVKGEFDETLLKKTITYAIERRRNLEKLHQANERYSLATKATHDLVWDWDLSSNTIYRDEQAVKDVYGFSSNSDILTPATWYKRIHPDDLVQLLKTIQELKDSADRDFFELEYRVLSESGIYKIIYDRGYLVRNTEGKPVRMLGASQDITEKKKLERALEESRIQQQRAVTEATIKGQEKEREQLGKELHDNINQILATSRLYLDHALSTPAIDQNIVLQSRQFIVQAIEEIRKLSHALLPPAFEEFGLAPALDKLADSISLASNLTINKQWDGFEEQILQKDQKLTIYRIVQEQLNNIIKYAEASCVIISIVNNETSVQLLIKDNGKGFDPSEQKNGVGLRNIISRAELFNGNATIRSKPGEGCEIKVILPVTCTS